MSQPAPVDYYRLLKVKPTASTEQIRAAYLTLAKQQHPDRGGSLRAMRRLNQAYETLRDTAKRTQYDNWYRSYRADKSLGLNEDLDIDEVDEFLRTVYAQERRQRWLNPFMLSMSVALVAVLVFVVVAVGHMLTTADTVQVEAEPAIVSQEAPR